MTKSVPHQYGTEYGPVLDPTHAVFRALNQGKRHETENGMVRWPKSKLSVCFLRTGAHYDKNRSKMCISTTAEFPLLVKCFPAKRKKSSKFACCCCLCKYRILAVQGRNYCTD